MSPALSSYSVSVDPGELGFSAAHFITFNSTCENLHGHNFHVRVNASGGNDGDELVVDFVLITRMAGKICRRLHDKVLLPSQSAEIRLEDRGEFIHVSSYDKRFVLPADNCYLLPVRNATAEMLAFYICSELLEALQRHNAAGNIRELEVAVEEADRQWGIYRLRVDDHG